MPLRRIIAQGEDRPPAEPVQGLEIRPPKLIDPAAQHRRGRRPAQGVVDRLQNRPARGNGWLLGRLHERGPVVAQDQHPGAWAAGGGGGGAVIVIGRARAVVAHHAEVDASPALGLSFVTLRIGLVGREGVHPDKGHPPTPPPKKKDDEEEKQEENTRIGPLSSHWDTRLEHTNLDAPQLAVAAPCS